MRPDADDPRMRIKAIEREYLTMRLAADRLMQHGGADASILREAGLRVADLAQASARLEATYFIRLFAAFENALRDRWMTWRTTRPKMEDLVNGLASRRQIAADLLQEVHEARNYRNSLVHEFDERIAPITLASARRSTCLFLGYLF
ncbi:hypothetical protein TA3x_003509 [Tundrisphaera sp. TA3]|uniref:hypothetical protein n=1 Tax=Tundrisphaera sp. TA3 TaxID=3435775 RepID=UPI003EBEA3A9